MVVIDVVRVTNIPFFVSYLIRRERLDMRVEFPRISFQVVHAKIIIQLTISIEIITGFGAK